MHKLARRISLLLVALLAVSALVALPVSGSTGNILIEVTIAPSPPKSMKIGETVNLYFGSVVWSGGSVDLYLSKDGYASLTIPGDVRYGPTFSVAIITNQSVYTGYSGYSVGFKWINGTIPTTLEIPGGKYYVKAFDGATAAVAVTDNYITLLASFEVTPASGPGGAALELKGYALPANDYANLSYDGTKIIDLYQANDKGRFVYTMTAPDKLGNMAPSPPTWGESVSFTTLTFQMVVNSTAQTETKTYKEYWRGLMQVKGYTGVLAPVGELYGNLTDFGVSYGVQVKVQGSIIIAGKWFYPGTATLYWDKATLMGTTTVNGTGFFNTTVTVPISKKGSHNITIADTKAVFIIWVEVIPTLILDPTKGVVGTTVTANGYGFPAPPTNVTIQWDYTDACITPVAKNMTYVLTDENGHFMGTFTVPATVGGSHTVKAIANDTAATFATATFTVLGTVTVSPAPVTNNGTVVTITGSGYAYNALYTLLLNSKNYYTAWQYGIPNGVPSWDPETAFWRPNCTGHFVLKVVIDASFRPGDHSVSLYKVTTNATLPDLDTYTLFTVEEPSKIDEILNLLKSVNATVVKIDGAVATVKTDVGTIKGTIVTIDGNVATIKTDVGLIKADVSLIKADAAAAKTSAASAATDAAAAKTQAASAATAATAAQTAAQQAASTATTTSTAVYAAIILALIAAIASIVAVITLQRKIAG